MAREADKSKSHLIEIEMVAKEKIILLREQMLALRNALRLSETEAMQIKKELEKEVSVEDNVWFKLLLSNTVSMWGA